MQEIFRNFWFRGESPLAFPGSSPAPWALERGRFVDGSSFILSQRAVLLDDNLAGLCAVTGEGWRSEEGNA